MSGPHPARPWLWHAAFWVFWVWLLAGPASAQSLFSAQGFRALTADHKAYRVGDVLTVQVFENSSANTSVDTDTQRDSAVGATLNHGHARSPGTLGVSAHSQFSGGGRTQRSNRLLATLTVNVHEVLPGGDLRIGGEQLLMVNDEQQQVVLEGRVRALDIAQNNVVPSQRIADARITYVGQGDVSERSRRSWWRKFLDALGL